MIISHKHRFIFFAVPKTATHAIRQALKPHLDVNDWEQQMLFGRQSIPVPEIAAIQHGHISFQDLTPCMPDKLLKSYFKFAIVRNPYDRFVSTCFFLNRKNPDFRGNEVVFMQQAICKEGFLQRVLVKPQYQFLVDAEERIAMDHVGHYESLQTSFDEICTRVGITSSKLAKQNSTEHESYKAYFDASLMARVKEYFRKDFEYFGYESKNSSIDPLNTL